MKPKPYPSLVCYDCGLRYGRRIPVAATWHMGRCGVCDRWKSVSSRKSRPLRDSTGWATGRCGWAGRPQAAPARRCGAIGCRDGSGVKGAGWAAPGRAWAGWGPAHLFRALGGQESPFLGPPALAVGTMGSAWGFVPGSSGAWPVAALHARAAAEALQAHACGRLAHLSVCLARYRVKI